MTYDQQRPLTRSKIVGWLLRRFSDIKNRSEAIRLLYLVTKGYLIPVDKEDSFLLRPDFIININGSDNLNIPLDICGICKHFTAILSFQPEVTLSCGHSFHRACLACLQFDEMGRCTDCESNILIIKTNTEQDLILPFITKILSSPTYAFKPKIDQFVVAFCQKYTKLNKSQTKEQPKEILLQALEELSTFIVNLNDMVLQDLRLLMKFEHGFQKCLLILKKCIIPKIYGPLFQLYIKVHAESDKKLYQKITRLLPLSTTESMDIKQKFRLTDNSNGTFKTTVISPKIPVIKSNSSFRLKLLSTPVPITKQRSSLTDIHSPQTPKTVSNQHTPLPTQTNQLIPPNTQNHRQNNHRSVVDQSSEESLLEKDKEPYIMAIQELDRMLDYTDLYDKLNCLILVRHYIQDSITAYWKKRGQFVQDDLIMDTDNLILILSYVIIHCQVPHLFSEFNFIDDFIDPFSERDEPGYCVTILNTALLYIRDTLEISPPLRSLPQNQIPSSTQLFHH